MSRAERHGPEHGEAAADRVGRLGINPDAFGIWQASDASRISWTDFLDGAAAAGYELVELGPDGYLPTEAGTLRDALRSRNLSLTCGYIAAPFHTRDGLQSAIRALRTQGEFTRAAGASFVLLLAQGASATQRSLNPSNWKRMIAGVIEVARVATDEIGLTATYHPHVGFAVETATETDRFATDTHGSIGLCFDTGQWAYAGGNPAKDIANYNQLINYVHLRDLNATIHQRCVDKNATFAEAAAAGVFCEPGRGIVAFDAIANTLREARFDGPVVVERSLLGANCADACAAAERAYSFYDALGFGRRALPGRID